MAFVTQVTAIGWRAHAALTASAGRARMIAPLSASCYAEAAGELIWVGSSGSELHPRAVLVESPPLNAGDITIDPSGTAPWRPPSYDRDVDATRNGALVLRRELLALGAPRGLAQLFVGSGDGDPVLVRARPFVRRLACAAVSNDAAWAIDAARPLLGLGEGLTPSGDDFVGGVLFARHSLAAAESYGGDAAVRGLLAAAQSLTHPVSARLLADLAAGEGWAPLHDLTAALATRQPAHAMVAAKRLTGIGHSSGWDLLAGLLSGLLPIEALRTV